MSVCLVLVGGVMYWNNVKQGKNVLPGKRSDRPSDKPFAPRTKNASTTADTEPATDSAAGKATAAPTQTKSPDDLKVSNIILQRTRGSSLIYAVGTLKNNSDLQRFGVRLELELLDSSGNKIGTAKDYAAVIEPRRDWRFRALVLAQKTASVRVAKIKEDE